VAQTSVAWKFNRNAGRAVAVILLSLLGGSLVRAQNGDFDPKMRLTGYWWHFQPTGYFNSAVTVNGRAFDLNKDFGFGYNSTFSSGMDWRFTRRQHLLVGFNRFDDSRTVTSYFPRI